MHGRALLLTAVLAASLVAGAAAADLTLSPSHPAIRRLLKQPSKPETPYNCAAASYAPTVAGCLGDDISPATCTAKEVQILGAKLSDIKAATGSLGSAPCCGSLGATCATCTPGQVLTGTLVLRVNSNTARYSAGLWVAQPSQASCKGGKSKAQCKGNKCSKRAFSVAANPGLVNHDAASDIQSCCADLPAATVEILVPGFELTCEAAGAALGAAGSTCASRAAQAMDWCFGWAQNPSKDICYTSASAPATWLTRPGTGSKCACGVHTFAELEVALPQPGPLPVVDPEPQPGPLPEPWVPTCGQLEQDKPDSAFACATGSSMSDAVKDSTVISQAACCDVLAGPELLDPELAVTSAGGNTVGVGATAELTITITNSGAGEATGALLSSQLPAGLGFVSASCAAGSISCETTDQGEGATSVDCALGDVAPGASVVCSLTVRPAAAGSFAVDSAITLDQAGADNPDNNAASSTVAAVACGPDRRYDEATASCVVLTCNPCAEAEPKVYLTTGQGAQPGNSLWEVRYVRGRSKENGLEPAFLCVIDGMSGMVGDIAVLADGSIAVLDVRGNLHYIPAASIPAPLAAPPADAVAAAAAPRCQTLPLFAFPAGTGSYTGLSNGWASNVLYASNNLGDLLTLDLGFDAQTGEYTAAPATASPAVSAPCDPTVAAANAGGTDVTPGPDGQLYRLCARDTRQLQSTSTRFSTAGAGAARAPTGAFAWTSRGIAPDASADNAGDVAWANAGAFCTADAVVSVATFSTTGKHAGFFETGVSGGVPAPGSAADAWATTPPASLVSYTKPLPGWATLRVNGAAVAPVCS